MYELNERFFRTLRLTRGKPNLPPRRGKTLGDVTMKMVKKILLGLAATAAVIGLVGCSGIENNNAEEKGDKWDKTIEVDGTELQADSYKRAFVQLGSLEQVQEVTTTLTCKKADVSNSSVIGFAFDLNYEKDNTGNDIDDKYNFYLVGFRPSDGKFYLERYKEVSMKDNNGATKKPGMGNYISYMGSTNGWNSNYAESHDDWQTGTKGTHYSEDTDGNITLKITVKQATDGTYTVKLGNGSEIACPADTREINKKGSKLQGGIALYANAKQEAKFSVTSVIDKKEGVVGSFYEEIEK